MRRRAASLAWLALSLAVFAGATGALRWALDDGRLASTPLREQVADGFPPLAAAAVLAGASWLALRGAHATLRRRGRPTRSLGQLQTMAAAVVVFVALAGLVGDASTVLISLGLVGFGLTLALQRPILALAGWATIFFGGMFREGDRIQVGDLEGDVLEITLFTTKLWEIGERGGRSPGRPTARIRTLSNAMFVEQPVANATSDTAIVFDEFAVTVGYEADLALARRLLGETAEEVVDPRWHEEAARAYEQLTRGMPMEASFPKEPLILLSLAENRIELRLRYLVEARAAARVRTRLAETWQGRTAAHRERLPQGSPRQAQAVDAAGRASD